MDEILNGKMKDLAGDLGEGAKVLDVSIRFADDDDTIELIQGDRIESHKLKPLSALYSAGNGVPLNTRDETFLPLLHSIEEEIVRFDATRQRLTDAFVLLALDRLSINPDDPSADPLIRSIQKALRVNLSLNNYSRQEVRQALRKIGKSVGRHKNGERGYLRFIEDYFGRR